MIQQLSSNFLNPKREFPEIFNGLGHAKINYKISLQPDAKLYALCTPRRVPIPLMKQVKEQLEEMTRLGVIESVEEPTEWCAGMVAVSKPGGKIRICVDLTKLNQYIRRENYPLPATEHILGQLGNACYFSKLDANSGFWQFGLAKESQKLTTFITPFGRFFFKRIPFGITSAPEIFQRKMTQLLGKIEGVVCFMDDIVVYGSSLEEHNERVRQVLKKIQEEGMTLNPEKCQFGVKTVKFLGHTLSSEGLFIDEEKLDAITKMEAPRSTKELKSFLGMVNYLGKFIPNLADKLQPLNSLLSTKNEWVWDEPQKKSFNLLKQELVSRPNLALFNPSRTTIVSADASSFGLGGVLRQEQPDGSLKPIAYVSRTLSETEKRYSQIEKEGLAIVWTCDRLKDYVTGIKIHIETDHKPLIAIFTSKSLADMLSRKPMSKPHKDELEEELSAYIQSIEFPATEERLLEISRKKKEDSLCSQLAKYCMSGWPKNKREVDPALRGYWQFQEDLTYQNGLLLRGQRILIPKSLRKDILEKLHQGHFGINKCRSRAKESVWWLGISQEIERMVSSCTKCLKERKPKHEPLMPSEFPIRPWQKVGMDLFYLNGRWYLIVCDYYSRYPEISLLQNLTAQEVISRLKSIFARHGIPETVRSDNGPQFQKVLGSEFSKFSKEWSFKHITSSPKFPQSNGFIEAIIKKIKQSFKKEEDCYLTLQAYRTMPLESGYSPAELLMGRRLRTSVPAIESSLMPRYLDSEALQEREKRRVINQKRLYDKRHDVHSLPPLQQGDSIWIRDQRVEGTVLHKSEEPRSYWVQTPQGKVRRNRLHLTPLPKMGSTMDASEDGQRQEQRNEETPTSTSTWPSRRCKDDQEQETEEDCPTPTASSTRDGRMQRDNQDQDPEKSLPSMPAVHTRYGRAVKIPRRTTYRLKNKYYWPSMLKDVSEFVKTCHLCQSRKGSNHLPSGLLQPIPPANYPFERIKIDFVGPLPSTKRRMKWIIVLTDYYTKYAETKAVSEETVKEASTFLIKHIILHHGAPRFLISDRGSQFTSNLMKEVMKMCKVKHCFTTSYHPQANGLTERLNRTLINTISMYVNTDQKNWDEILPFITQVYNTTIQETTGYSPFFLLFGREPMSLFDDENIPMDSNMNDYYEYIENYLEKIARTRQVVVNNTEKTQERMKRNYDKKHNEKIYEPEH
ncbi:K02A2.6-like [Cordylochernes scorpioides]|uniref:RNA-directed DNA polymerase n=1 Tax=Cordylochernes scorpioides TaxID=51811 RepID=A0ABY6LI38_9ARAC|nr:K02A2.6-like [Cordylochernes scorpioides]